jgi:hypothetical protein
MRGKSPTRRQSVGRRQIRTCIEEGGEVTRTERRGGGKEIESRGLPMISMAINAGLPSNACPGAKINEARPLGARCPNHNYGIFNYHPTGVKKRAKMVPSQPRIITYAHTVSTVYYIYTVVTENIVTVL